MMGMRCPVRRGKGEMGLGGMGMWHRQGGRHRGRAQAAPVPANLLAGSAGGAADAGMRPVSIPLSSTE